jgi:hypothetical protein
VVLSKEAPVPASTVFWVVVPPVVILALTIVFVVVTGRRDKR